MEDGSLFLIQSFEYDVSSNSTAYFIMHNFLLVRSFLIKRFAHMR